MHRFDDSKRLRLRGRAPDGEPIASVTGVWKTANWLEREVYDMFGIVFDGHPALERILTWEGFNGHPLRKDFPVEGIDTGAAIYPDVYPPGGGPVREEELEPPPAKTAEGRFGMTVVIFPDRGGRIRNSEFEIRKTPPASSRESSRFPHFAFRIPNSAGSGGGPCLT